MVVIFFLAIWFLKQRRHLPTYTLPKFNPSPRPSVGIHVPALSLVTTYMTTHMLGHTWEWKEKMMSHVMTNTVKAITWPLDKWGLKSMQWRNCWPSHLPQHTSVSIQRKPAYLSDLHTGTTWASSSPGSCPPIKCVLRFMRS